MAREFIIICPNVGEGNPAAAFATGNILRQAGANIDEIILGLSVMPARIFHRNMRTHPALGDGYNQNGEAIRRLGTIILGPLSRLEIASQQISRNGHNSEQRVLIAVQEHPLASFSKKDLEKWYPGGKYLVIPDVEPKQSAVDIIKNQGLTPIVWNEQARERLDAKELNPLLAGPLLPQGYMLDTPLGTKLTDRILIKASGSGMPGEYTNKFLDALRKLGIDFQIVLPDKIITQTGESSRKRSLKEKITEFYQDLLSKPPRLFIAPPSEMVQVATTLQEIGVSYYVLPPNGPHEMINLKWAQSNGVALGGIDPLKDDIPAFLLDALSKDSTQQPRPSVQTGKIPFSQALFLAS